jgi:tetratricopeptide (TPR) repeat protein
VRLAEALVALDQFEEAERELTIVMASGEAREEALAARADLCRFTNRPHEMAADLDQLLALDPENAWALAYRAAYRHWTGDCASALTDYNAALEVDSSQPWIWAFRGLFHLRFGRTNAARDDFQRAITLDPEDPWIRRQWADLLRECKQALLAAEVLECLIEDHPEDGYARMARAELHLLAGEWPEAEAQLTWLVEQTHDLAWLAHAALAALTTEPESRAPHLAAAGALRPAPTFWGISPALVLAQRALLACLEGDEAAAATLLAEAGSVREPGEPLWHGLRPLLTRLEAVDLLAVLDALHPPLPHLATAAHD